MKNEIKVFDPPMCCSSGVCGTSVNLELVRFAGDLEFLKKNGVAVKRFNLSSEPAAFVAEPIVKETLAKDGKDCLPLTVINGEIVGKGSYLTREELLKRVGLDAAASPESAKPVFGECGPGCSCNCAPTGGKKIHKIAGSVILIAALCILGVKLARAQSEEPSAVPTTNQPAFAVETVTAPIPLPSVTETKKELPMLSALNELNSVAMDQDAVLVFIPNAGNDRMAAATESAMLAAQKTLTRSQLKLGLYTLDSAAADYPTITAQTATPAILMAVKGRGMMIIPADSTESKILQAFMSASNAGGCGSGGCGPRGCN